MSWIQEQVRMWNEPKNDEPHIIHSIQRPNQLKDPLIKNIFIRHQLYRHIRMFFHKEGYIEVETPILVKCPGIDPYIDAISVEGQMYLATSPELQMKRLLGMGLKKIFQFTKAFRKGEEGNLHNPEFGILEWYHVHRDYDYLMDETEALIRCLVQVLAELQIDHIILEEHPFPRYSIDELFEVHAGWHPSFNWDEQRFFLDFIDKIEPFLASRTAVIIYDFPAPVASLARLKPDAPHLCERFELYLNGLEVANAFSELIDPNAQKERFLTAQEHRRKLGKKAYPIDTKFLKTLEKPLPPCTGIAMGLDRLVMALTGEKDIKRVMPFTIQEL